MVDLKRAAYQKMLAWKGRSGRKTLEVSGARQVGKTYLVNKFADERSGREEDYQEISALYQTYRQIGGYPSVVLRYLSGASMKECQDIDGIVNENFVYLDLKRRSGFAGELALEMPAFATWGRGELDFYTKSLDSGKTYVIEVKAGKNSAKTAMEVLEKGKADYLLLAKGNTHGGAADKVYTISVYGISKFKF